MENSNTCVRVTGLPRCHVLPLGRRIAYSVGHVLNDLCASMWFTYLLIYQQAVLKFSNKMAGGLMLWGQVADAIATPLVGIESDRRDNFFLCRYGKRKTWHLIGTVCVALTFPFLFITCIHCEKSSQVAQFAYYATFITIFQFGWAATQVSHLSLIPDLTPIPAERVELNVLRYAMTVMSNICAFSTLWLTFGIADNRESHVGPKDAPIFQNVALLMVAIGIFFSTIFHIFVKEKPLSSFAAADPLIINESLEDEKPHLRWKDWFKQPQFYMVALLYMSSRLYINVSQIYMPLYIQESLKLHKDNIAIIPLVIYVSSFGSSFVMKYFSIAFGNKVTYFVGCVLALASCVWMYLGENEAYRQYEIYFVAVLIGMAGSTLLIVSISITSDLIANSITSGAFVFGAMSFVDKMANGLVIIIIQDLHPCIRCCEDCKWYYEYVIVFACGGAIVLGLIALAMLFSQDIGVRHNESLIQGLPVNTCNRKTAKDEAETVDEVRPLLVDDDDDDGLHQR